MSATTLIPSAVPDWMRDTLRGMDESAQRAAMARWAIPVTTAHERAMAQTFVAPGTWYPCVGCGKFAFPSADVRCFWCRQ